MVDQERERRQGDCEWMEWPVDVRLNDLRQRALAVIATTRYQWASSGSAPPAIDGTGVNSNRVVHPLLRRAFDARHSNTGAAKAVRARSRRRA